MSLPKPLPGLLPAAFRGIGFYVTDASSEAGRRIAAHYFPGLDIAAYDDLGKIPEKFSLSGFYIGDDYISHGKSLKLAFEQPGVGTLMHPQFGAIRVIMTDSAKISFSAQELRLVRFDAAFERAEDNILAKLFSKLGLGSIPKLIAAGVRLVNQAQFMVSLVSGSTISRLFFDAAMRVGGGLFGAVADLGRGVSGLFGGGGQFSAVLRLSGRAAAVISGLLPANPPSTAAGFTAMLETVSTGLVAATVETALQSAIAPAAGAVLPAPLLTADEAVTAALQLAAATVKAAALPPSSADAALYAALAASLLGAAAQIAPDVAPESRKQALELRSQISAALDEFSNSIQPLFETPLADGASRLYRAAREMRLTAINDINETIGRLPATVLIELDRPADAWGIANMLYGDNPHDIEAGYADLVSRNGLRHPAAIPEGRLEILQ